MTRTSGRSGLRLGVAVVAAAGLLTAACSSASPPAARAARNPKAAAPSGSWPYPNGDLANTRVAPGSVITSANVARLQQAWSFRLPQGPTHGPGAGLLAAAPIVTGGVVYLQDLDANVYAIDLATGKLKWEYRVNIPEQSGPGPDGVAVASGRVYGETSTAVFALSSATGKPAWIDRNLLGAGDGKFEIQPQVADGRVYLASAYGLGPGGGLLFALNAATGALLWKHGTLLAPDKGVESVGAGSGGAWETPLVSASGTTVTFGTGNPYQNAADAIADPSPQLYSDSDVTLNAATGALRWYYQGVANDFMDHDMQASPIAATINGAPAVIGGGKMGVVYAMNAATGRLIWKTPVGEHGPSDSYPARALAHTLRLKAPYTVLPGSLGGVLTNMSVAGGSVYVATVDLPFTVPKLISPLGEPVGDGTGEIEALSLSTGKVEWDTRVSQLPLGATTVSNDLVFTTLFGGYLIALDRATGAIVYRQTLPAATNSPIAIAGNAVLVPAGAPAALTATGGTPQLLAFTVR
jgi:alcohol dehydrogenase (cytochrome c)